MRTDGFISLSFLLVALKKADFFYLESFLAALTMALAIFLAFFLAFLLAFALALASALWRKNMFFDQISISSNYVCVELYVTRKKRNKYQHILNGNRDSKSIIISHWNGGSAKLENKLNEIESKINRFRPHVLGLSESNLDKGVNMSCVQISGYKLVTCPMIDDCKYGVSRIAVYVKDTLTYKIRRDLMDSSMHMVGDGRSWKKKTFVWNDL